MHYVLQHGLLIIEDIDSRGSHDSWNPAVEKVHLDDDSLYVAVQPDVVGPVREELGPVQLSGCAAAVGVSTRLVAPPS
jgi:hypothetical protein